MIDRRTFVVSAGAAVCALPARAQSRERRVGMLVAGSSGLHARLLPAALRQRGYSVGENLQITFRSSGDSSDGLAKLASELVALDVDVIVASLTPAAAAAKRATSKIPIVALVGDAVAAGLVPSLARPGGNLTGVSLSTPETAGKVVEVLRDAFPHARRAAVLVNANDPSSAAQIEGIKRGSATTGIETLFFTIKEREELDSAFNEIARSQVDAAIFQPSLPRTRGLELARLHRIPIFSWAKSMTEDGGLASYATSVEESYRIIADCVDRILRGAKAGDIPMQQPTRFDLVINLKTARELGVALPQTFLDRADEVIE